MKPISFFSPFLFACLCLATSNLIAQDKKAELELAAKYSPINFVRGGNNDFFMICAGQPAMTTAPSSNAVFKVDANLKPLWKEPIVFKGMGGFTVYTGEIFALSYTDPTDQSTIDYVVEDGSELFQSLPNGTLTKKDTDIPKKERYKKAALFTNAAGLNILTIKGDETFPTGTLNWYTFAHKGLASSKRTITLPVPPNIDEDNESGWRLNQVTESGLFFYYVSYKNKVKDESRPILSCHVVQVDLQGKTGPMINIDLGLKKYTVMRLQYQQSNYPGLIVDQPKLSEWVLQGKTSTLRLNENAYMGVQIDAENKRIITVTASNDALAVSKTGAAKAIALGTQDLPVENLNVGIYGFDGKEIAKTPLKISAAKRGATDDFTSASGNVDITALPGDEGFTCRFTSNGTGRLWLLNPKGEIVQDLKLTPLSYKENFGRNYDFTFASPYFSLKDFNDAPYMAKEKSRSYQFFQKLDDKEKKNAWYISLKDAEVLAVFDSKGNAVKLNSFKKN